MEKTGFTLKGRVLCLDESCIGVVGPDRKCKVCGLEYAGDDSIGEDADAQHEDVESPASPAIDAADTTGSPGERTCCPDEACIGIIGADGRCGTCGRPG